MSFNAVQSVDNLTASSPDLQHTTTNSSVQNTKVAVHLDWFQFHLPNNSDSWSFLEYVFKDMVPMERSRVPGYDRAVIILNSGTIAWSENSTRKEDRIFVQIPASALSLLDRDPFYLMHEVVQHGGTFSRLDFAFDSFGQLDLLRIKKKLESHEVQTRWRSYTVEEGAKSIGSALGDGLTVYVGNRKSESFLRIYDKTGEQTAKLERAGADSDLIAAVPPDWVRVELESKKRKANALGLALIEAWRQGLNTSEVVAKHLYSLVDFKNVRHDVNRSRWLTCDWWLEFLDVCAKEAIKLPAPEYTLARLYTWIEHIAPALAVAASVDIDWLLGEISAAQRRFRLKHKRLLLEAGIKLDPAFETDDG